MENVEVKSLFIFFAYISASLNKIFKIHSRNYQIFEKRRDFSSKFKQILKQVFFRMSLENLSKYNKRFYQ